MAFLILHVCGLFCAPDWHSWVVSVLVGLPFCSLELLMLLLKDGQRPATPVHYFPFSAVRSHGHLSCCLVFSFSASLDYAFTPFGLAVTGCISPIKCSRASHSPLPPLSHPAWKERDESETTAQLKAVTYWHRTKTMPYVREGPPAW